MERTINFIDYSAAKNVSEIAAACGYTWAEWSKATTAEKDHAVTCARKGLATIPAKSFPTELEQRKAFLSALRGR